MIKTPEATQLCTKSELELFSASLSRAVKGFSERELKQRIVLVRKARDKFRSLAEGQLRQARGKQDARGRRPSKSAQRTVRKVQLFDETLTRYEDRLRELQAQSASEQPKSVTRKVTKKRPAAPAVSASKKRTTAKGPTTKANQQPKPAEKTKSGDLVRQRQARSGLVRQQKHLSAQGKRTQARRDSR